jgi:dihydropteroate synthase
LHAIEVRFDEEIEFLSSNVLSSKSQIYFKGHASLILNGSINDLKNIVENHLPGKIKIESLKALNNFECYTQNKYQIGNSVLDFDKPLIMGILNVTPDSFSDGGKYLSEDKAIDKALKMIDEGADIIDIGGESTRPGSEPVSTNDELSRTIPVIKKLKSLRNDITISIDTTKSEVAQLALDNGASIINDISGLTFDLNIIEAAKKYDAALIIMHIKGNPKTMQENPFYEDVVSEVYDFLHEQSLLALNNGISKIIIDPGIGFGKRAKDNFELISRLDDFKSLGYPILIGLSKKSFIGSALDLETNEIDFGTSVLETLSTVKSARIIRTHNVQNCSQMVKLLSNLI